VRHMERGQGIGLLLRGQGKADLPHVDRRGRTAGRKKSRPRCQQHARGADRLERIPERGLGDRGACVAVAKVNATWLTIASEQRGAKIYNVRNRWKGDAPGGSVHST
jgi:hypothetical protein